MVNHPQKAKLYPSNTFTTRIDKIVYGGYGLCNYNGIKVFVPYGVPLDYVQLKIKERKKTYYKATIHKLIEPSPFRTTPPCQYFTVCGGCDLQHIKYENQLRIKQEFFIESLQRISKLNLKDLPALSSSQPFHYRNKTQYPLSERPLRIGFYQKFSHNVINIDQCLLHPPLFDKIRESLRKQLNKIKESIYNEKKHKGNLRHIIIRQGMNTNQVLVIFVTRTHSINPLLYKFLPNLFPNIVSIIQNVNPERTNRILGKENIILYGKNYYQEKILDKTFNISASAFFQVNVDQAKKMVNIIKEYLVSAHRLLDLYCGVGFFAIMLSELAKKVIGIEINADAIHDAQKNAQLNNINNIEFIASSVENVIQDYKDIDTIILDPPRKGCSEKLLTNIIRMRPEKIIYISCNPATFARDLVIFQKYRYRLDKYHLIDMFPQTYHVESIAKIVAQ